MTMDVHYESANKANAVEVMFVTVQYLPSVKSHGQSHMQLLAYERISTYSIYRACGDGPNTESLCICNSDAYYFNKAVHWLTTAKRASDQLIRTQNFLYSQWESLELDSCVFIIRHSGSKHSSRHSSSVYALNRCQGQSYKVRVRVADSNHTSYSNLSDGGWIVKPSNVQFLLVVRYYSEHSTESVFEFSLSPV